MSEYPETAARFARETAAHEMRVLHDDARVLRRLAELMDEDDARTGKVGIPVSYGHYLLHVAVSGTSQEWDNEFVRILRTESRSAAIAWANQLEAQFQRLIQQVYPGGAVARARSAAEVRELADAARKAVAA